MSLRTILIASLVAFGYAAPAPQYLSLIGKTKNDVVDGVCRPYTRECTQFQTRNQSIYNG